MSEFWYKESNTWRKAKELYYKESSVWRKLSAIWYRESGTWRKVFSAFSFTTFGANINHLGNTNGTYHASITWNSDGTISKLPGTGTGSWGTPTTTGIGSTVWVKVIPNSFAGTPSYGGSIPNNTWTQLSSAQSWDVANASVSGESQGSMTIQYSLDGGSTVAYSQGGSWDVGKTL